jgi:hypothetical protein
MRRPKFDNQRAEGQNSPYQYMAVNLLCGLALAPFVILSVFSHPYFDDFWPPAVTRDLGFWQAQVHFYKTWTGRYFCMALSSINPLLFNSLPAYKTGPIIWIALLFISNLLLLKTSAGQILSLRERVTATLILLVLYFFQMPSFYESFYWMAGAITYHIPTIMLLSLFALLIKFYNSDKKKRLDPYTSVCATCLSLQSLGQMKLQCCK